MIGKAPSGEAGTGQQAEVTLLMYVLRGLLELELLKPGAFIWGSIFKKAKYGNMLYCENVPEVGEHWE